MPSANRSPGRYARAAFLSLALLSATFLVALWLWPAEVISLWPADRRTVPVGHMHHLPVTISFCCIAGDAYSPPHPWTLSVNSAGQAHLTLGYFDHEGSRVFDVSREQYDELRDALARERFFDLDDEYGQNVLHTGELIMTVAAGRHTKQVRIKYLHNYLLHGQVKMLRDPARALRIWVLVRAWFQHLQFDPSEEPIDNTQYYQKIINAASGE